MDDLLEHRMERDVWILYHKDITWRVEILGSKEPMIYKDDLVYFDGNERPTPVDILLEEER